MFGQFGRRVVGDNLKRQSSSVGITINKGYGRKQVVIFRWAK